MSALSLALRSPAPNPAAAQALLELTGSAPKEGALPADALGYARRGHKEAGQVAGRSDDPGVLAELVVGERRKTVLAALLSNESLPPVVAAIAAEAFVDVAGLHEWVAGFREFSPVGLDAVLDVVGNDAPFVGPKEVSGRLLGGYARAALVMEARGFPRIDSSGWLSNGGLSVEGCRDVVVRLNEQGLHKWAAQVLLWVWKGHGKLPADATRAGLESLLEVGAGPTPLRLSVRNLDIPSDLAEPLAGKFPELARWSSLELPAEVVADHAAKFLDVGWIPTMGRWSDLAQWPVEVQRAVAAALRDAAPDQLPARGRALANVIVDCRAAAPLAGAEDVPASVWAAVAADPRDGIVVGWWLHHSAGRVRAADEAIELMAAVWPEGRLTRSGDLTGMIRHFLADPPGEWTDDDRERVRASFESYGDYSDAISPDDLGKVGPAAILGDDVAAWKMFYSLADGWEAGPLQRARAAAAVATGE